MSATSINPGVLTLFLEHVDDSLLQVIVVNDRGAELLGHGAQFWQKALGRESRKLDAIVMKRTITEKLVLKLFDLGLGGKVESG